MQRDQNVAIFWDFETAQVKSRASGYRVTKALRDIAHSYGFVRSFRAYLDVARQSDPGDFLTLRREIHCSGVSIVDCPSVSRKDVADKAMIVDMLTLAMDEALGCTILIATGDRDLSYALAILRFRGFKIILVCPPKTDESLLMQADDTFNWNSQILGIDDDFPASSSSSSSASSSSSSSSSKHTLSSYLSYPAPPLSQNHTGGYNRPRTRRSQTPSPRPPSSLHLSSRVVRSSQPTDVNNAASELKNVADGADTFPAISSPALSAVPSMNNISPAHISPAPHTPKNTGFVSALASPFRTATAPHSRPRARSDTVSGDCFFPPAPSFPLEAPLPAEGKPSSTDSPPTSSSEAFSVVDHPNSTAGNSHTLTSSTAKPTPPPALTSLKNVSTPGGSSRLSTTPAQVPQVASPPPATVNHDNVTSNATLPPCTTPTPATGKSSVAPMKPETPCQGPSPTLNNRAATSTSHTTPKALPVTPTPKPAPLAEPSVTTRPTQTKTSNSTAQTGVAAGPPRAVPRIYQTLVKCLQHQRQRGVTWPTRSVVASELLKRDPRIYKSAGVKKWSLFAQKAEDDGIITVVGDTISLTQEYSSAVIPPSQ